MLRIEQMKHEFLEIANVLEGIQNIDLFWQIYPWIEKWNSIEGLEYDLYFFVFSHYEITFEQLYRASEIPVLHQKYESQAMQELEKIFLKDIAQSQNSGNIE